jgi:ornithine--oxo-acid transaminase
MMTIRPGEHGSTYGGNPLACAVAITSLEVLRDENLADNAARMGEMLRTGIRDLQSPHIRLVRGKGLLNAIEIQHHNPEAAWDLCLEMMHRGLLAKPTHGDKIRFAPPLTIQPGQVSEALDIIQDALLTLS